MAERPHRLTVIGDYAKTLIAIGGALLAICVTFSANLPTIKVPAIGLPLIGVLWFFLLLSVFAAIWMMTFLIGVLGLDEQIEKKTNEISSAATPQDKAAKEAESSALQIRQTRHLKLLERGANFSYGTLAVAVLILFILGLSPREIKLDLPTIISRLTNETAQIKKVQPTQITVTDLKISPGGDFYSVTLSPGPAATPWQAEVDGKSGAIRSLH